MSRVLALLYILTLSGCAAYEQQRRDQAIAQVFAQATADDEQCKGSGNTEGTPMYVQCRMNLDNQRAQAAENNR